MRKGRVVRIWTGEDASLSVTRTFYVAIEHEDTAINAVLAAFPEFEGCVVEAGERLSGTAVAFLDMAEGEIRDRVTENSVNLSRESG